MEASTLTPPDQKNLEATTLRRFVRYLVAICIGVAGTLAWQAYGEEAKRIIASRAPDLGWSPEVRQTLANWTKPLAGHTPVRETQEPAPVAQAAPGVVAPTPAALSFDPEQAKQMVQSLDGLRQTVERLAADPEQVKQMAQSLDGLRQTVERLAAAQEEIGREITRLRDADQEILARMIPAPPPPSPPAAPTRKPPAVPPQRSPR